MEMKEIFETYNNIAVFGMSKHIEKPAFTVPSYMKKQGYKIIPINPSIDSIMKLTSYPDIASVPDYIEILCRRYVSEYKRHEIYCDKTDRVIDDFILACFNLNYNETMSQFSMYVYNDLISKINDKGIKKLCVDYYYRLGKPIAFSFGKISGELRKDDKYPEFRHKYKKIEK